MSIRLLLKPFIALALLALLLPQLSVAQPAIKLMATPDQGIQPRLINDADGNIHLLYFKKKLRAPASREGDLYYRQYLSETQRWSTRIKVSSQSFDMRTFSIARASFDIDGDGRIHVIWYLPKNSQYMYSRSNIDRNRFAAQTDMVSTFAIGLDAAADIAARDNFVAVVWGAGDLSRETERTAFARISTDGGASFGEEIMVGDPSLGACACCVLAADFDNKNHLTVAYRSAVEGIHRDMQLLSFDPLGTGVSSYADVDELQKWELSACPLSTNDIASDNQQQDWLVFETVNRIVQMNISTASAIALVAEPLTQTRQKNPTIAINDQQQRLIVWGESINHSKGGELNMALFTGSGENIEIEKQTLTIPRYSFPAAAALADDSFIVLY